MYKAAPLARAVDRSHMLASKPKLAYAAVWDLSLIPNDLALFLANVETLR